MLHEFALDPEVMSGWDNFRYFSEKLGVEHGRLISQFPKQWKRRVYEACRACADIERKKIEERLSQNHFNRKLLRSGRSYAPKRSWLSNAEDQQGSGRPFRLIIATDNPRNHNDVRRAAELDEQDAEWNVHPEKRIARTAADLIGCAKLLVQASREILLVDPYFDPQEQRFRNVFSELMQCAQQGRVELRRLELHSTNRSSGETAHWKRECQRWLPPVVFQGNTLRVVRWKERPGSGFHARYILTELGGIAFDAGTDEGKKGETTDVRLLSGHVFEQAWRDYAPAGTEGNAEKTAFDLVDEVIVEGKRQ